MNNGNTQTQAKNGSNTEMQDALGHIPFAKAEGKGWDIVITPKHMYFLCEHKFHWIFTLLQVLTIPLWIVPPIGALFDIVFAQIAMVTYKTKVKPLHAQDYRERLKTCQGSFNIPTADITTVRLSRKSIVFETSSKLHKFYTVTPIKKVCPQCRELLSSIGLTVR